MSPLACVVYGLQVLSDFRLPTSPAVRARADLTTVRIACVDVIPPPPTDTLLATLRCYAPCHAGAAYSRVYLADGTTWVVNPGVAACTITASGDRVHVRPEPGVDETKLGLFLIGEILTLVLQRLGRPTLHASAVVVGGQAIGFLGPQGRGKSTLAACFVGRGARLLTDDVLALRVAPGQVEATPGPPMMKLWPESIDRTLHVEEDLPEVTPYHPKKLVSLDGRYPHAQTGARLKGLYVLERYDPMQSGEHTIVLQRLAGRESITALLAHTSHAELLPRAQAPELLSAYASITRLLPISRLRFPDGFEHQAEIHARLMSELENT